jgi:hypothetical protein
MSEATGPTTETDEAPTGDYQALAAALAGQKRGTDTEVTDEPAESDDDDQDDGNTNREAAKWRTKLRDTEAQRNAVTTQLANMQRAAIDNQVTALGIKPAALWASGAQLADLLNDAGVPDAAKVEKAAQTAKDTLGLTVNTPRPKPAVHALKSGASSGYEPTRDSFVEAFGPKKDTR